MNYILVILQIVAGQYNWVPIGEFATERACIAASVQISNASQDIRGVRNFQCLSK